MLLLYEYKYCTFFIISLLAFYFSHHHPESAFPATQTFFLDLSIRKFGITKNMANRSLEDEKQAVKRGLSATMHEGAIWQPVSTGWMQRWKMYVNFDVDGPDMREKEVLLSLELKF